jgi:hypothetical protein
VYGKKDIFNGFSITGQVAFDHLRTMYINGRKNSYSTMAKKGQWHWEMKAGYFF